MQFIDINQELENVYQNLSDFNTIMYEKSKKKRRFLLDIYCTSNWLYEYFDLCCKCYSSLNWIAYTDLLLLLVENNIEEFKANYIKEEENKYKLWIKKRNINRYQVEELEKSYIKAQEKHYIMQNIPAIIKQEYLWQ